MKALLLLVLYFQINFAYAQSTKIEEVEVELDKEQFKNALPFDVKFKVIGTLLSKGADVSIVLDVQPKELKSLKHYFKVGVETLHSEFHSGNGGTFSSGPVGPIRPNTNYRFKFSTLTRIPIDQNSQEFKKFRDDANTLFETDVPKLATVTDIEVLSSKLNQMFLMFISGRAGKLLSSDMIVSKLGNTVILRSFGDLKAEELADAISEKNEGKSNISLTYEAFKGKYDQVKTKALLSKLDSTGEVEKHLRIILASPDNFETFVKNQFLNDAKKEEYIEEFTTIYEAKLKNIPDAQEQVKENVISKLNDIKRFHLQVSDGTARYEAWKNHFSDKFTTPFFVAEQFVIEGISEIDVTSEKTPYVSLDVGLNSRFEPIFNGLTQFHLYQGANIYLNPVNKRAPLSYFKFPTRLWKTLSFNIGIAQRLGAIKNPDFKATVGETTNFLVGTGLRLNRIFKVNFNLIFFKLDAQNPVIDRPRLKPYPFIAVSIDANVAKALGPVGQALGL